MCYVILKVLRSDSSWGLLLLRWFSGCDTVSAFRVIGNNGAGAYSSVFSHSQQW